MAPMALTAATHIGIGFSPVAAASSCSCSSSSSSCSPRPQRRIAASGLSASGVHASGASSVFRDGRELLAAPMRYRTARRPGQLQVVGLFGLGVPELVVIAGVAALLFGPKKLPEIGKSLGKTVKSFQQAAKEFETEVKAAAASDTANAAVMEESKPAPKPVSKPEAPPAAATAVEKDSSA